MCKGVKANPDKICWNSLSKNENAIDILEENIDKINWWWLSKNPNATHLFIKYKYDLIKNRLYTTFGKELIEKLYHPSNAHKWIDCE